MTTNTNGEQPLVMFSHTMTFPGVPLENLVSSLALLLSAYGVIHQLPTSPTFTSEGMTCGDDNADARFVTNYMQFKLMLEDLARQYKTVQCTAQSNGSSVYMKFSCY